MSDNESPNTKEAIVPKSARDSVHEPRKRARRACLYCRARKVRCDVSLITPPCTNCKLDKRDCVIKPRARKWPCTQSEVQVFAHQSLEQQQNEDTAPAPLVVSAAGPTSQSDIVGAGSSERQLDFPCHTSSDDEGRETYPSSSLQLSEQSSAMKASIQAHDNEQESHPSPKITASCWDRKQFISDWPFIKRANQRPGPYIRFSCYPFVGVDTLRRLSSEDITFLHERGCFHLPEKAAFEEFITEYFRHVHPILPVLNEADFWRITSTQLSSSSFSESQCISLFLFQAILFISSPFVALSTLRNLGYDSVQNARADLYSKAKALFDIDISRDDVISAQGALMLTYHAPSANARINTYWLSTAIHFARNARADQYATMDDDVENKIVLKRLWWCCVLRDRIMALGLRRPLYIRPSDFDFDQPGFTENDFADEIRSSKVYNPATKRILVQLAISLCELGAILNDILDIICPMKTVSDLSSCKRSLTSLEVSSAVLDGWYEKTVAKFLIPTQVFGAHRSLVLFTDMVYMYYFTAKAATCIHLMLLSITGTDLDDHRRDNQLQSQAQLDEALRNITDILAELQQLELSRYLPNTFISFSAFPFVWQILNAKVFKSVHRSDVVRRDLNTYAEVMNGFRNLYENTEGVLQCIEKIVEYIKQNEPLQLMYSRTPSPGTVVEDTMLSSERMFCRPARTWADLLRDDPHCYLRISLTVEFSLYRGQFPSEHDFPKGLQTLQRKNNQFLEYRTLTDLDDTVFYDLLQQTLEAGRGA